MMTKLFLILIVGGFSINVGAANICGSVQDCQLLIAKAIAQRQVFLDANGQRISRSGSIFTRDFTNPKLGEAYRDPSGLVWGEPLKHNGRIFFNHYAAGFYCDSVQARLPTLTELEQLSIYFGMGTSEGYSPFMPNTRISILPGYYNNDGKPRESLYWGPIHPQRPKLAYTIRASDGYITSLNSRDWSGDQEIGIQVRCVTRLR